MAGIYIHIPFCKSRCRYCDFFSTTQLGKRTQYVQALLAEWRDRQSELTEPVQTIYIGGGTPSTLEVDDLRLLGEQAKNNSTQLYTTLHHTTPSPDEIGDIEFTMEANPGDITLEKARSWREIGINRLSIGIQSFDDDLLRLIGRRHTAAEACEAVRMAQAAGFDNISIDLMYALPTQTMQQWQNDVQTALRLGVQHISSYGLIYEEGTAITKLLYNNKIEPIDEELEMQMYDYLIEQLTAHGFEHYEVSNFALSGRRSRHNSSYWNDTPYLGLGAGAHSYDGRVRRWNISDLDQYIQQALSHSLQPEQEVLSAEDRRTERIMLSLRTNQGVSIDDIDMDKAKPYIQHGLLTLRDNRLAATTQGFHVLNRIIEDLV